MPTCKDSELLRADRGMMTDWKKRAFSLVFAFSFFIYAASPLSYAFADQAFESSTSLTKTASFSGNIGIFLWELIYKELAPEKDTPPSGREGRVLFRKARAILAEKSNPKSLCQGDVPETERIMPFQRCPLSEWAPPTDTEWKSQCYNPLHSGPSPPSA